MQPILSMLSGVLLAGNLLLAVPVRQDTSVLGNAEQTEREIRKVLIEYLTDRGLEAQSARNLVSDYFGSNGTAMAQSVMHLMLFFPELHREEIVKEFAKQVLHRERIALDDYDYLVGLISRLAGVSLSTSHYERIRQCALLNRMILSEKSALDNFA